jgi:hypothetical protein
MAAAQSPVKSLQWIEIPNVARTESTALYEIVHDTERIIDWSPPMI